MSGTVVLPYDPATTTAQDVHLIRQALKAQAPSVQFLPFPFELVPVSLADLSSPRTITVTLSNNPRNVIFDTLPGKTFFAPDRSKAQLVDDLIAAGLPVPHTGRFSPDARPDPAKFGPYVTIKTTAPGTDRARNIYTVRTAEFEACRPRLMTLFQKDMASGHIPLLQQYIVTGETPTHTTVSTCLGAPVLCYKTTAPAPFSPAQMQGLVGGEATSNHKANRTRQLSNDAEMVALARSASRAFPTASVLSIDMVRCEQTQKLYCLEVNLGNLCVLSSPICSEFRAALGERELHNQFGSYTTIARRMIETLDAI